MAISADQIKALRDETGVSVMQCKKALEEAGGDRDKALVILRKKGGESALKKGDRELGSGTIGAYVHTTGEIAAVVVLSCETDFVAKNEAFAALARELAMQVAATDPRYTTRDEIGEAERAKAREVFRQEVADKPAEMQDKIIDGKLASYFTDQVLLDQPYIKDPAQTIGDLLTDAVQKFGENIAVREFHRVTAKG
jgi:elongation factor Ts